MNKETSAVTKIALKKTQITFYLHNELKTPKCLYFQWLTKGNLTEEKQRV